MSSSQEEPSYCAAFLDAAARGHGDEHILKAALMIRVVRDRHIYGIAVFSSSGSTILADKIPHFHDTPVTRKDVAAFIIVKSRAIVCSMPCAVISSYRETEDAARQRQRRRFTLDLVSSLYRARRVGHAATHHKYPLIALALVSRRLESFVLLEYQVE